MHLDDSETLIKVTELGKKIGNKQVLNDISLTVKRNEFLAVTGKSGSGKSSLVSILGLLDIYTEGEFFIFGKPIASLTKKQIAKLRNEYIGWVFQEFNLINDLTVIENVLLPSRYASAKLKLQNDAESILRRLGLNDHLSSYPSELSGGQQQRVAIARSMIMKPELLFLDEPTGNLDSESSQVIAELLKELHSEGVTIVLVTHDSELANSAEQVITLKDGQLL